MTGYRWPSLAERADSIALFDQGRNAAGHAGFVELAEGQVYDRGRQTAGDHAGLACWLELGVGQLYGADRLVYGELMQSGCVAQGEQVLRRAAGRYCALLVKPLEHLGVSKVHLAVLGCSVRPVLEPLDLGAVPSIVVSL